MRNQFWDSEHGFDEAIDGTELWRKSGIYTYAEKVCDSLKKIIDDRKERLLQDG